jgi:toxin CptA
MAMVKIRIRPSRQLALLLALAHVVAAAVPLTLPLTVWAKGLLLLAIAASLGRSLWGPALLRAADAVVAVEIGEGGAASYQTRRGDWHHAALLDTSFVAAGLTVLNFRIQGSWIARHIVIMPDSVAKDDFRRLRVWLRWGKTTSA